MKAIISPTLIFIQARQIGDRLFRHAEELAPGYLSEQDIALALDHGWLREVHPSERRSLYKIFYRFSGCNERQPLPQQELESCALAD
jgi:hypothetical protein